MPSFWTRPTASGLPASTRHVSLEAEFHPAWFVRLRDRCRHVAAHGRGVHPGPHGDRQRAAACDRVR